MTDTQTLSSEIEAETEVPEYNDVRPIPSATLYKYICFNLP
jgi:hypothetical protein